MGLNIMIMDADKKEKSIELAKMLLTFGGLAALFFMTSHPIIGGIFAFLGFAFITMYKM